MDQKQIRLSIMIVGSIFVLGSTYFGGMKRQTSRIKEIDQVRRELRRDLRVTQMTLQAHDALLQQLEARRQLDLARQAAGAQNFGIAKDLVNDAVARLNAAATVNGVGMATTGDLAARLQTLVSGTTPPDAAQLVSALQELDKALDTVTPKADAISAVTVPPPTANDAVTPDDEMGKRSTAH